ncbi:hypothetical protein XOCgx_1533 [Xanthomonas oryzae pv. oryzicola]|nr:hypothetical protein XOCgx_1533 [Xanthomonas oryzae pv. oryzicola]
MPSNFPHSRKSAPGREEALPITPRRAPVRCHDVVALQVPEPRLQRRNRRQPRRFGAQNARP